MQKTKLIKTLTLISFFTMICLFVFYRAGMLTSYSGNRTPALQQSPNGGALPSGSNDSTSKILDSTQLLMLSSSKSIVMTDQFKLLDSTPKRINTKKLKPKQTEMLSSSKSGIVIRPLDTLPAGYDSVIKNMLKKKKQ